MWTKKMFLNNEVARTDSYVFSNKIGFKKIIARHKISWPYSYDNDQ